MEAGKSPDWLPAGWTEQVKVKNDRKYKVYIDPLSGCKFYSKPQVSEYLRTVQHNSPALQQKKTGTVSVNEHNTSELTGGKTYMKEEEPQNAIKVKETSRKSTVLQSGSSMQPVEEVFQLLASDVSGKVAGMSPEWLPAGWTEHVKDNNGRKVKCYVDPLTGRKFYSKPQVSEYLRTVELKSSASQPNKNANICELTGGKTTLKPKGSQVRTRSSKQIDMGFSNDSAEKPKMDELTGGETSVKEGKSQNDKPLKQTSCKSERTHTGSSMQRVNKVVTESVTPDGLPPGWRKEIKIRKKANGTRKDPYYTDPVSGYVFFSQKDALRYLETGDVNSCSIKPKKRDELGFLDNGTSAKMGELSGATNSRKLEGSQNVKITKRKSHAPKVKPLGSAEQPVEKGVIERVATEALPPGWLQETYFTDPVSGYVFFSLEDALCYLETGDFDRCIVKPKKRDKLGFMNEETSPNMSALTSVKNSLKQEGAQNVITPRDTRHAAKQREMGFSKVSIEKSNMIEITGGQLMQEGSQNVKTSKSTSRLSKQKIIDHSKQSVENEMIERVTPDGLPPEWIKEIRIQKKASGTRKDTYYTDPVSGYVFLSHKDALRYLKSGDIRKCAMRPKKRDELGFLNGASCLQSVAATQKTGDHTPKRQLFAGMENSVTRSLETADTGGPLKRQRVAKGTQNSVTRSSETADAGGPQKRQRIRKEKLSPVNAIEGADTKECHDPSSSPSSVTKGSKRKQGKIVGTENRTVSNKKEKSTNSNAKNKSNRKSGTGACNSRRKKAVGVPSRSSSRLVGHQSKMVKSLETEPEPSVGHQSKMVKSLETEPEPSVGHHYDVAHNGPHQFGTVSATEIADNAPRGTEAPSNVELSNTSNNPLEDQAVALEDQAVAEDQPSRGETVITELENQDRENPFGESWSDPCLEFAFKTLSGEMPVKDNLPAHGNFQEHSENPNPQAGGCLALLDFGVPNSHQNNNNVVSNFDAQEGPVSDSGPISPTFLASGNVSSLFFDSPEKPVSDSIPPGFSARSPTFDAPSKPVSDSIPPGFSACSPTFDAPSKPLSDFIPPGFSARSPIFDAPKHVADAVPHFPNSSLFPASRNASSPFFDAPLKHVADSVPWFANTSLFPASGNANSPSFHAPAKPESDSAPQVPTTHAFLNFANFSSPNRTANAPQQPNWEENKDHRPNLNL